VTPPLAITFDFWDTLVHAPSGPQTRALRQVRLVEVLHGAGHEADPVALDRALAQVRRTFDEHWAANEQFTGYDATALLLEQLGISLAGDTLAAAEDAFMGVTERSVPPLTPNVESVLRSLSDRGVKLGIICDVGLSPSVVLRSHLEHHGVLDLFDHWSFSDEVGAYKPSPVIFQHALDGLGGVDPAAAAHVGDLRRTDVAGAIAFGMTAVRYAGSNDDVSEPAEGDRSRSGMELSDETAPEAHHVITDHHELLDVLGF
jgi:putative hydrolase of the HAD superfamily